MIKNRHKLEEFYKELVRTENISHKEALRIYDVLHKKAVALGIINSENILEGLEVDLRIARAINGLSS